MVFTSYTPTVSAKSPITPLSWLGGLAARFPTHGCGTLRKRIRTLPHPWQYDRPRRDTQVTRGIPGSRWILPDAQYAPHRADRAGSEPNGKGARTGVPGDARFRVMLRVTGDARFRVIRGSG